MYQRILVATDGSESSRLAFSHAVGIAQMSGAEIILLHITFTPQAYWGNNLAYGITISEEEMEQLGNEIIQQTKKGIDTKNIQLTTEIVSGSPAQKIIKLAKKQNTDLIIMGSHGHGPFSGAFLGSISQRVLAKADCPVMIVKDSQESESKDA